MQTTSHIVPKNYLGTGANMKEKLAIIGGLIMIIGACYGVFTYLGKYALCEDVQKVEQKVDKTLQLMEYKFKAIQLETIENRIDKIEDRSGKNPKDPAERERLKQLERDREKVEREMKVMEKK